MGSMWWFLDPVASRLLLRLATSHRILRKRLWNCCYLYSHLLKGSAPSFAAGNFRVKQTVASNANKALKTSWRPCKVSQVLKTLNFRPGVEGGSAGIDGEQGASMGFKLSQSKESHLRCTSEDLLSVRMRFLPTYPITAVPKSVKRKDTKLQNLKPRT